MTTPPPWPPAATAARTPRAAASRSSARSSPTSAPSSSSPRPRTSSSGPSRRSASRFCVTSSMADAVLSHLASRVRPGVDVVFLDTGYHFAETIGTRDAVEATLPVNLISITPVQTVAEQDAAYGKDLYQRDPDLCCALRKVKPLARRARRVRRLGHRPAPRRDPQPRDRAGRRLGRRKSKGQGLARSPAGPTTTSRRTSPRTASSSTRSQYDGYPSIGCWPVHPPRRAGRGPAQRAAGPAPTRPSAASTS